MDIQLEESADSSVHPELPPTPPTDFRLPEVLDLLLPRAGIREKVKVSLQADTLLLYRRDYLDGPAGPSLGAQELREVEFQFEIGENEGLGITIVGEQPVKVSRIFSNSPADRYSMQPDDLITAVNRSSVSSLGHDRVADILKNLSGAVSITVERAKQPLNTSQGGPLDPVPSGWKIYRIIPLLHASVSLYKPGAAVRIENGLHILDESGESEAMLQCDSQESSELLMCVLALKRAIQLQEQARIEELNRLLPPSDAVAAMGWLFELQQQSPNQTFWVRRFFACTRSQVRFFSSPPANGHDWERCEARYDLMTLSCHILKEKKSLRSNSFLLSSGQGNEHILSPETWEDLLSWINTINSSIASLIAQDSSARFLAKFENRDVLLELNFPLSLVRMINARGETVLHSWPLSAISHTEEDTGGFLIVHFDSSSLPKEKPDRIRVRLQSVQPFLHVLKSFLYARIHETDPAYARTFTLRSF